MSALSTFPLLVIKIIIKMHNDSSCVIYYLKKREYILLKYDIALNNM